MINEISVKIPSKFLIPKTPSSFEDNFDPLIMNNRIEAAKFEPEPTLEKTINMVKYNHLKSINYIGMNVSYITPDKTDSYSEHLKFDFMSWIILQSPRKPPQFTKHLSSMQPKVNNQLQIRKWKVPLQPNYTYPFFSHTFVNTFQ